MIIDVGRKKDKKSLGVASYLNIENIEYRKLNIEKAALTATFI